jgi:tritrans,polycis-undecaprenyl-diphosphate synthase [geranylgeranyl-diphosphate specific]
VEVINPKKSSLKKLTDKKISDIEKFALKSYTGKRVLTAFYQSDIYKFVSNKINDFRNLKLRQEIKQDTIPKHIAIIMDGNRRFAGSLGLSPVQGHFFGKDRIEKVLDWCFDLDIKVLTIYAFSTENFNRTTTEVNTLMHLCNSELERAKADSRIHRNKVRIRVIGQLDELPEDIQASAQKIMNMTKEYDDYHFNIALAYSGREEIVQAIKRIAEDVHGGKLDVNSISPETVSSYMYTNGLPDPDLILRTSGEERISNFLLWQLAYSELYFSDVYWPAFQKRDFLRAIQTYQKRKRRFGK